MQLNPLLTVLIALVLCASVALACGEQPVTTPTDDALLPTAPSLTSPMFTPTPAAEDASCPSVHDALYLAANAPPVGAIENASALLGLDLTRAQANPLARFDSQWMLGVATGLDALRLGSDAILVRRFDAPESAAAVSVHADAAATSFLAAIPEITEFIDSGDVGAGLRAADHMLSGTASLEAFNAALNAFCTE